MKNAPAFKKPEVPVEPKPPEPEVLVLATLADDTAIKGGLRQAQCDASILHACLSRVARLLGHADEHMPEHTADLDTTGVSEKYAGIVAWAKGAKLP